MIFVFLMFSPFEKSYAILFFCILGFLLFLYSILSFASRTQCVWRRYPALLSVLLSCMENRRINFSRISGHGSYSSAYICWFFSDEKTCESDKEVIRTLSERAIGDFHSPEIIVEYVQWACGVSIEFARQVHLLLQGKICTLFCAHVLVNCNCPSPAPPPPHPPARAWAPPSPLPSLHSKKILHMQMSLLKMPANKNRCENFVEDGRGGKVDRTSCGLCIDCLGCLLRLRKSGSTVVKWRRSR